MATRIIVSYDDTDNDRDALALGRLLAFSGAELSLAYVRHSQRRSARAEGGRGAAGPRRRSVGAPDMPRHVIVNPGTSVGLRRAGRARERRRRSSSAPSTAPPPARSSRASRPTNCCSAARRRSPSPRPACARTPRSASTRSASSTRATRLRRQTAESLAAALGAAVAEFDGGPDRPARRRLAARVARRESHPQRLQRLRGRGRDLPGAGRPARRRAQLRGSLRPPEESAAGPAVTLDDEDDGRDLRVAAVDPPRAPRSRAIGGAALTAEHLGDRRLRQLGLDHEGDGQRGGVGAAPAGAGSPPRPSARRSTSPARRRGRAPPAAGPQGSSACSRAAPTPVRRARSAGRSATARATLCLSSLALRLKARAWLRPRADLDVEGHETTS